MARDVGGHFYDPADEPGSNLTAEYHWRGCGTADHERADDTNYNQISDSDWKRIYLSGFYTEDPISPFGTETTHETFRASIEPRDGGDTETRSPEPDPNDGLPEMPFDISIGWGFGPIGISHTLSTSSLSHTDTYRGNLYWHHWDVPTADMPIGEDDAHGVSVIIDTLQTPEDSFEIGMFTSSSFSYVDPGYGGIGFQDTGAVGGFADFDVVDGDLY